MIIPVAQKNKNMRLSSAEAFHAKISIIWSELNS